jgi:hypothetical protein
MKLLYKYGESLAAPVGVIRKHWAVRWYDMHVRVGTCRHTYTMCIIVLLYAIESYTHHQIFRSLALSIEGPNQELEKVGRTGDSKHRWR